MPAILNLRTHFLKSKTFLQNRKFFGLPVSMENNELGILLVEDDPITLQLNKRLLSSYGKVFTASSFEEGKKCLDSCLVGIAFFDLNLQGRGTAEELEGLTLIDYANEKNLNAKEQAIHSVVVSGESQDEVIESAFLKGAKDYLLKPFNQQKLNQVMARFFNQRKHVEFEDVINRSFITKSKAQVEEIYKIKNLTISDKPIFINGETGTGKRVVSHLIRDLSGPSKFIEVNCSQYTEELLASELFGHKKGAFTGAHEDKVGLLEEANGGIIFLDEIHALSQKSQKILLKAIEEKEFYPVGSNRLVKSNFRVVTATCENIQELIAKGQFREDLFARISTFQVNLLPLRERKEDILLLFEYFISKHLVQILITKEAKETLKNYWWPRNTREIQDLVENWIVNGQRLITPECLAPHIRSNITSSNKLVTDVHLDLVEEHGLNEVLAYLKKELAQGVIKRQGTMKRGAEVMGVSYSSLSSFLKQNKDKNLLSPGGHS